MTFLQDFYLESKNLLYPRYLRKSYILVYSYILLFRLIIIQNFMPTSIIQIEFQTDVINCRIIHTMNLISWLKTFHLILFCHLRMYLFKLSHMFFLETSSLFAIDFSQMSQNVLEVFEYKS